MANTLATILDDAGNRALVEKYLVKRFLERRDYDTPLANSQFAQTFRIPDQAGQYVEVFRKNRFRLPENVSNAAQTADPASGASMGGEKVKLPLEYLHEYVPISTIASWTSWVDLEAWVDEDLPMALMRRRHQLAQNAFKVGRMTPGVWGADGNASTAFDASAQATVTLDGISFTFASAPAYFVSGKPAFAALGEGDRFTMDDFIGPATRMANAGAIKLKGGLIVYISDAIKEDLFRDDKYFRAAVDAWKGQGIRENELVPYRGLHWMIDDEPFTENWGAANVRASSGPLHTAIMFGANAFAYLNLGSKSKAKPTFKVQDITKTGKEKTIGYTVPHQVGIVNRDWCATITGPVTNYQANG